MKKLSAILTFIIASNFIYAQVAIGKTQLTSESVSLEFGNVANDADKQKGILLPYVTSESALVGAVPGTVIFDTTDKKLKYRKGGTSPHWVDLTLLNDGNAITSPQEGLNSNPQAKVAIGENETGAPGILVLEDTNKAMILPLIDSYTSIENPSAGMMAYDLSKDMLCVFNGTQWTFWKAED